MSHESVERVRPPLVADESTMLVAWLDWHRETLAQKVSGVDPERMREATAAPTTLTLLGLVRHMADNERYWFREVVAGEQVEDYWAPEDDPEADFRGAHPGWAGGRRRGVAGGGRGIAGRAGRAVDGRPVRQGVSRRAGFGAMGGGAHDRGVRPAQRARGRAS